MKPEIDGRAAADGDVEALAEDVGETVIERQRDPDVRIALREIRDEGRDPSSSDRRRRRNSEIAARVARAVPDALLERANALENPSCLRRIFASRVGQRLAPRRPQREPDVKPPLEPRDRVRHNRGRDAEPPRRSREAALAGDDDERLHVFNGAHRITRNFRFLSPNSSSYHFARSMHIAVQQTERLVFRRRTPDTSGSSSWRTLLRVMSR